MDYRGMTRRELQVTRAQLETDLADAEEIAAFHFANSSAHISGHEVRRESERWQRMQDAIAEIDELLTNATPE
jgi:hypothetical protein